MTLEHTVDIGTDVAGFFLFHPDDLKHRGGDPLDWYAYDFACRKEFETGNLIAFLTGGDGGYQLRLTGGDLTDAEQALSSGSWTWGLTVRHGRILVDNSDFLPSEEARAIGKAPQNQWVAMPNGHYRVTVHPVAREDDSLPDYVVRFEPVEQPLHIAESPAPPSLIPGETPQAGQGSAADAMRRGRGDNKPLAKTYPLLVAPGQYVLPRGHVSLPVSDALFEAVGNDDNSLKNADGDMYVILAPTEETPGLGTLAWLHGSSRLTGSPGRISLSGERLVRVTEQTAGNLLPTARVELVTRAESLLDKSEITTLQEAFAAYADSHTKGKNAIRISLFERERIAAMTSGDALTTRLIELVPMPVETRFRLHGASDTERAKELHTRLKTV